jgi:predicted nucleic acid-binding protein
MAAIERGAVFVDTSALYALLDASDAQHAAARATWVAVLTAAASPVTHGLVVVETIALVQRRLGLAAVQTLTADLLGPVEIIWLAQDAYEQALATLLILNRREVSLVDCASFLVMRERGVTAAFAFDDHFAEQGFILVGAGR